VIIAVFFDASSAIFMSSRGSLRGAINLVSKALGDPRPVHGNLTTLAECGDKCYPSLVRIALALSTSRPI